MPSTCPFLVTTDAASILCVAIGLLASATDAPAAPPPEAFRIQVDVVARGDEQHDWRQARTSLLPGQTDAAITVMSQTTPQGAHGYRDVYFQRTSDGGRTWTSPAVAPSLKRARQPDGADHVFSDLWPTAHPRTKTVLITGKIFTFEEGTRENTLREHTAYAVFNPQEGTFGSIRILELPESDRDGRPFISPNAGCHQPVCLANGDVLLPVRYQKAATPRHYTSCVMRCRFDGQTLEYVTHGTEHTLHSGRGLYEPSLTEHGGKYYFTMRADDGAFVTRGADGVTFPDEQPWRFDDGELLGSRNTQQHWLSMGGRLYLIYTRAGAGNDDVFRHRAPLFIGQVDPERLCVLRATEQVVLPNDGGLYGNSGICRISDREAWITCADDGGKRRQSPTLGNEVLLARLRWIH